MREKLENISQLLLPVDKIFESYDAEIKQCFEFLDFASKSVIQINEISKNIQNMPKQDEAKSSSVDSTSPNNKQQKVEQMRVEYMKL